MQKNMDLKHTEAYWAMISSVLKNWKAPLLGGLGGEKIPVSLREATVSSSGIRETEQEGKPANAGRRGNMDFCWSRIFSSPIRKIHSDVQSNAQNWIPL